MDMNIAQMLADVIGRGGNVFVFVNSPGEAEMDDEANEVEPVEGPGPDGSAQHEKAEGEAPEAGDNSPANSAKRNQRPPALRGEIIE